MAKDVNKAIIIGRLGQDPEVRHAPSGDAVCNLSVATSESWKDKSSGETKSKTEWHRVVIWGKLAEVAAQYLKKGSQVYIEGKLETRKWTDNNGVDKYTTEIKLDGFNGQMQMLGSKSDNASVNPSNNQQSQPQAPQQNNGNFGGFDDDAPF